MSSDFPRPPYRYSPISSREPIVWPGGARLAFCVALNVEYFHVDAPSTSIVPETAGLVPDPMNYGWRDYGLRVGIWRLIEVFDRYRTPVSALVNSEVCTECPQVIEAGRARDWAWVAHGVTNSRVHNGFDSKDEEREALREIFATLERACGARPSGWLGPALSETFDTPALLAEVGGSYLLDWCNDDQPYPLDVGARMISVPYSIELNDIPLFIGRSFTGPEFRDTMIDWFDQLYREGESNGRVMTVALHPFVVGQPSRARYLAEALEHVASHDEVWLATSDEIAAHYYEHYYDDAIAAIGS